VILLFLKKDAAAVLKSSKIEGVRFPLSRIGASFPPMKVVRGARPGRDETVVEDMTCSKEESGEIGMIDKERVLADRLAGSNETKGGGSGMFRLCDLVARLDTG
jgi:hypothetical protein